MVLTDKFQAMCYNLKDLMMDVVQFDSDEERDTEEFEGLFHIKTDGKKGNTEVHGDFLYRFGILINGLLCVKTKTDTGKITSIFSIEPAD